MSFFRAYKYFIMILVSNTIFNIHTMSSILQSKRDNPWLPGLKMNLESELNNDAEKPFVRWKTVTNVDYWNEFPQSIQQPEEPSNNLIHFNDQGNELQPIHENIKIKVNDLVSATSVIDYDTISLNKNNQSTINDNLAHMAQNSSSVLPKQRLITKSEMKCNEYNQAMSKIRRAIALVGPISETIKSNNNITLCRQVHYTHLIIKGIVAALGEFPHMVALGHKSSNNTFTSYCGGTLISNRWVLTAAHCILGGTEATNTVYIGIHRLSKKTREQTFEVKQIIQHPMYRPPALYNDIALIELKRSVQFGLLIKPACLHQHYDTVSTNASVSGWGITKFDGDKSDVLRKATLQIIDNAMCASKYKRSETLPFGIVPSMLCAIDQTSSRRDTCKGDSGGPLQVMPSNNKCLYTVVGITSFGQDYCFYNVPGVYTRVSHYLDWIENIVWPDES